MKACMLLPFLCAALAAQTVEGVVVDAVTGKPLAGAHVSGVDKSVVTGADGHFSLPRGRAIALQVGRAGYVGNGNWWLARGGANPSNVRVALMPEAVISGKVVDEDGFPVADALVEALRYPAIDGQQKPTAMARTSDLGEYRLDGRAAGRYRLLVMSLGGLVNWDQRYVPEYYPGTLGPGDAIQVRAGEEHAGADILLTKLGIRSVSGRILVDNFSPTKLPTGYLTTAGALSDFVRYAAIRAESDGFSFIVRHVPSGSYTLRVISGARAPQAGDLMVEQHVDVGGEDITGLVVRPRVIQAVDVSGTVVFEYGTQRPVTLDFRSGSTVSVHSNPDGSFVAKLLLPAIYGIAVRADAAARAPGQPGAVTNVGPVFAISTHLGGREVPGQGIYIDSPPAGPLRVTVAGAGRADGKVLDAAGDPVAGAEVLFQRTQGTTRATAVTDSGGNFLLGTVALGEYRVYVVTDQSQAGSFDDPDYLDAHAEDFPPARIVDENNAAEVMLRLPAAK